MFQKIKSFLYAALVGWWKDHKDEVQDYALKAVQALAAAAVTAALRWVGGYITSRNKPAVEAKAVQEAMRQDPDLMRSHGRDVHAEIKRKLNFELAKAENNRHGDGVA